MTIGEVGSRTEGPNVSHVLKSAVPEVTAARMKGENRERGVSMAIDGVHAREPRAAWGRDCIWLQFI